MTKLYTITELCKLTAITVRTLHYYDAINLLKPQHRCKNKHRLYSENDLLRLQQIITLKFMGFSLQRIKRLIHEERDHLFASLKMQSIVLSQEAIKIKKAVKLIDSLLSDEDLNKAVHWQTVIKIIEILKLKKNHCSYWYETLFNQKELLVFKKLAKTRTSKWIDLFVETKKNINTDPKGSVGQKLIRKWLALIDGSYGSYPALKDKLVAGYKAGIIPYIPQDKKVVSYLTKALSTLLKKIRRIMMDARLFKLNKIFVFFITFLIVVGYAGKVLSGTVLITNVLSNSVTMFDEATLKPVKEIKVGFMPHEVVASPDGQIALVSNYGDLLKLIPGNTLTTIDIARGEAIQTIQLPEKSRPHGIVFLSDKEALVTAQGIQALLVINVVTGRIKKSIALPGAGAHMVIVDEAKHYAYVANMDSGSITKINLKDYTISAHTTIGKQAEGLTLSKEEDLLLATDRKDDYVAVIRTKDLSLLKKIPTDCGPVRVALFADGKLAVVTNSTKGNAQVIDLTNLAIKQTLNTTDSLSPLPLPINVYVRKDQKTAYFTHAFINRVTLVNLIHGKILKTFKSGHMPDGIAISSTDVGKTTRENK